MSEAAPKVTSEVTEKVVVIAEEIDQESDFRIVCKFSNSSITTFRCHKLILRSNCKFFHDMFETVKGAATKDESQNFVEINDFGPLSVEIFLKATYGRRLNIIGDSLDLSKAYIDTIKLGQRFQNPGAIDVGILGLCETFILQSDVNTKDSDKSCKLDPTVFMVLSKLCRQVSQAEIEVSQYTLNMIYMTIKSYGRPWSERCGIETESGALEKCITKQNCDDFSGEDIHIFLDILDNLRRHSYGFLAKPEERLEFFMRPSTTLKGNCTPASNLKGASFVGADDTFPSDYSIVCWANEDRVEVLVHRLFLGKSCQFFAQRFKSDPSEISFTIDDVNASAIRHFLRAIYSIPEKSLSLNDCFDIIELGRRYKCFTAIDRGIAYLCKSFDETINLSTDHIPRSSYKGTLARMYFLQRQLQSDTSAFAYSTLNVLSIYITRCDSWEKWARHFYRTLETCSIVDFIDRRTSLVLSRQDFIDFNTELQRMKLISSKK